MTFRLSFAVLFLFPLACKTRSLNDSTLTSESFAETLPPDYIADKATLAQAEREMSFASSDVISECQKAPVPFDARIRIDSLFGVFSIARVGNYDLFKDWHLEQAEFAGISTYSGSMFGAYNWASRGSGTCFEAAGAMTKATISALNKLPGTSGTLYSAQRFKKGTLETTLVENQNYITPKFMSTSFDIEIS